MGDLSEQYRWKMRWNCPKMERSIGTFCPNSKYGNTEYVRKSTLMRMNEKSEKERLIYVR